MRGAEGLGLELLPVVPVNNPSAVGLDVLAWYREGEMANDRDKVTLTLDDNLQHREAVVGVVKCYALDASDEGFRNTVHAGIITHVLDDPMRIFW